MTKVKKIGVLSAAKIEGLFGVIIGLVSGVFWALASASFSRMWGPEGYGYDNPMMYRWFGVGAIIIMPIVYGVLGFICGAIGAWLYNLVAGWIGGLEIELEK